jgi:hypothetical protein
MIMKIVEVGVVIYVPEYRGIKSSTIPIFREKPTVSCIWLTTENGG